MADSSNHPGAVVFACGAAKADDLQCFKAKDTARHS
jgi:hypothetical protein